MRRSSASRAALPGGPARPPFALPLRGLALLALLSLAACGNTGSVATPTPDAPPPPGPSAPQPQGPTPAPAPPTSPAPAAPVDPAQPPAPAAPVATPFTSQALTLSFDPGRAAAPVVTAETSAAVVSARGLASGAFDAPAQGARYLWATVELRNAGPAPLRNLTLYALSRDGRSLGGTAFEALGTADGQAITDPMTARGVRPQHGMAPDGAGARVDPAQADFQAYTPDEAGAVEAALRRAATIGPRDQVLGYGFVARAEGGGRTLAPGASARVTIAYRLPTEDQAGGLPARLSAAFALAEDPVTRVTRWSGESADAAAARGAAPVNATRVVLPGDAAGDPAALTSWPSGAAPMGRPRTFTLPAGPQYGVIQPDPRRLASDFDAGIHVRTLELAWDRFEPADGRWNDAYIQGLRAEYQAAVSAGFQVVLDPGVQYPPRWLLDHPNSHFVDQHGSAYDSLEPGANPVNAVFSAEMRAYQARYLRRVFGQLGSGFSAVRLGWGRYGELGYPPVERAANSYWAYDDLAQGRASGLAAGLTPAPQPGWRPASGAAAPDDAERAAARAFGEWYMRSLQNYHDWQVGLLREVYPGRLFMLYPSFGLRPGQLERAEQGGLRGGTSPEINTEVQRGFDFERFVGGIRDPLVSPYTTWLDADGFFVNDAGSDTAGWSPVHYLASLAAAHPLRLTVWGENTGRNSSADLARCFERVRQYRLGGMFWAFDADLYDAQHASVREYAARIAPVR